MDTQKKIIFLNAGTETRRACVRGIGDTPYAWYHTKRMALHIANDSSLHFLYKNIPINWDGGTSCSLAYVGPIINFVESSMITLRISIFPQTTP